MIASQAPSEGRILQDAHDSHALVLRVGDGGGPYLQDEVDDDEDADVVEDDLLGVLPAKSLGERPVAVASVHAHPIELGCFLRQRTGIVALLQVT